MARATTRITTPFGFDSTAAEVIAAIDLTGRRAIVTGRRPGIGVETARALAGAGAEVTLAVRDTGRGRADRRGHPASTGNGRVRVGRLDLADQASVAAFVAAWERAAAHARQQRRRDGAARARAHARRAGSCSSPPTTSGTSRSRSASTTRWPPPAARGSSRSARAAHLRSPVVFDDIHFAFRPYDPWLAYGQSKTANVLFAVEATRRWAGDGITANARQPRRHRRHQPPAAHGPRGARGAAQPGAVPVQDHRAGRRDERAARDLAAARRHRRPLLRGLQRGRGRPVPAEAAHGVAAYALDPGNAERLWDVSLRMLG